MSSKQIVVGLILVVGVGVSIYLWSKTDVIGPSGDSSVMSKMQAYTCNKCGAKIEMTVKEAGEMRRNNDGQIVCNQCGASDVSKEGAIVNLSFTEKPDEAEEEETQATEDEPVQRKLNTGRKKINP